GAAFASQMTTFSTEMLSSEENVWGFFFFQAEDGIRDFHVTGVQTCALPICLRLRSRRPKARRSERAQGSEGSRALLGAAGGRADGGGAGVHRLSAARAQAGRPA